MGGGLDEHVAEALLSGVLGPEDVPPGYDGVVALLRQAGGPGTVDELRHRSEVVARMVGALGSTGDRSASRARRSGTKLVPLKALAVAVPVMALTATSAAAATGTLPGPAQRALHAALAHVHISVPSGDSSVPVTAPRGPDVTGPAKSGLCRAYSASHGRPSPRSVAFSDLDKAASHEGETVAQFCADDAPGTPAAHGVTSTETPPDTDAVTGAGTSVDTTAPTHGPTKHPVSSQPGPPATPPGWVHRPATKPAGQGPSAPGLQQHPAPARSGPPPSPPGRDKSSGAATHGPPSSTPAGRH